MTQVANPPAAAEKDENPVPPGHVRLTIDGITVDAPKGELVIRTAERIGIAIPRFCDHPLLEPVGACRQCLVEVEMGGRPMPKPQASCTQTVADGMVVKTQESSPVAEKAQRSNLEFLLLNHPLDCPICDKGGECPLQNQTLANGSATSRMREPKRVFTKPISVSTEILLDRERCVLCQRCTRFSDQIAGDKFIDLLERGSAQQIGINTAQPFQSYFSGNTIQICPVGALTSAAYRFRSRPFDLVSTSTVCEHCASGCQLRTDHRAGGVMRRLAADQVEVNEEWNCDKGRFGFTYLRQDDRITRPMVRSESGVLEPVSWTEAMTVAARGLLAARERGGVGVLPGGRLTLTDAYAYAKFARLALRTNDIDFRARAHSVEEEQFLAARVVGRAPSTGGVTYQDLEKAPAVLLVALEPEEESPILFLRLRKASRRGVPVFSVTSLRSRGLEKMAGSVLAAAPGAEPIVLAGLASEEVADGHDAGEMNRARELLRTPGAVVLVGERAAQIPGLLTRVGELADASGARLAWVPRRAGERGAVEAGLLPNLLPGGYPVDDDAARAHVESVWGASLPTAPGRNAAEILAAVAVGGPENETHGETNDGTVDRVKEGDHHTDDSAAAGLAGLLIGGVEISDLPDPAAALAAVARAEFVVSLEIRASAVTEFADVVFPVAAAPEKAGAYLNWEGRYRPFAAALPDKGRLDEGRILDTLGVEMDVDLYTQTTVAARADMGRLGSWPVASRESAGGSAPEADTSMGSGPRHEAEGPTSPSAGDFVLASWRMALDSSRMLDGEPHLAGTAKPAVVRLSATAAARLAVRDGDDVTVTGPTGGAVTASLVISDMLDEVVWLPARINETPIGALIGAKVGEQVVVTSAATGPKEAAANDTAGRQESR